MPALTVIFAGLSVVLLGLDLVLTSPVATVAAVAVWGGFAFANMPPLQANVVQIAPEVARKPSMWPRA